LDAIQAILTRKSVRRFTNKSISQEDIHTILKAGMSGPTCVNARQWSFIAVTERGKLERMAQANDGPAAPLEKAALGILVCGDLGRAFHPAPD